MSDAQLIVCEKNLDWSIALRWALTGTGIRVMESRSWACCLREIDASARGLIALEMREDNAEEVCQRLIDLRSIRSKVGMIVLAERKLAKWEWVVRERGALHVVLSPRDLAPLARLVRRYLDRMPPHPTPSYRDAVAGRLPWPETERPQPEAEKANEIS